MAFVILVRNIWRRVAAYAAHDDPMVATCNFVALVVASNQPFYPLYVYWAVSEHIWPTFFTFLSTPFFLAVPALARRLPTAGRALLALTGIANTVLSAKVFGQASGVEIFLIPCALIAATFFRPSERLTALILVGLAIMAYLGLDGAYGAPGPPLRGLRIPCFPQIERHERWHPHRVHRTCRIGNVKPTCLSSSG